MSKALDKKVWIDNLLVAHEFDLTTAERIELLGKFYEAAYSGGAAAQALIHVESLENVFKRQAI